MLGRWPIGHFAYGGLQDYEVPVAPFNLENVFSAYSPGTGFTACLGRHPLGQHAVGTATLSSIFAQQKQYVALNDPDFSLDLQAISPVQIQICIPADIALGLDLQAISPIQIQICTPADMEFGLEFRVVAIFIDAFDLDLLLGGIQPVQCQSIAAINDLALEYIWGEIFNTALGKRPLGLYPLGSADQKKLTIDNFTQTHKITQVNDVSLDLYFDIPGVGQTQILQPNEMEFLSSFCKIFPTVSGDGYLFVIVNDADKEYKWSFEGIESA